MQNAESDNSTKNISDDEPENLQRPINNEKDKDVQKQLLNMMEKEGRLSGEEMSKLRNVVLKDWAPGTEVKVVRANPKESEVISDESENNSNVQNFKSLKNNV
uniref:Uncharacterized protein n=1 Tax=Megaselia scalaris TaxID=36166 RepID=T1GCT8_MEGSC